MDKNEFINGLNFITPNRFGGAHSSELQFDVSIYFSYKSKDTHKNKVNFTFRNYSWKKFGSPYLKFARYKNRLIIMGAEDSRSGYTLYKNAKGNDGTRYVSISVDNEDLRIFDGARELKFDDFYEYYYIEYAERKE